MFYIALIISKPLHSFYAELEDHSHSLEDELEALQRDLVAERRAGAAAAAAAAAAAPPLGPGLPMGGGGPPGPPQGRWDDLRGPPPGPSGWGRGHPPPMGPPPQQAFHGRGPPPPPMMGKRPRDFYIVNNMLT